MGGFGGLGGSGGTGGRGGKGGDGGHGVPGMVKLCGSLILANNGKVVADNGNGDTTDNRCGAITYASNMSKSALALQKPSSANKVLEGEIRYDDALKITSVYDADTMVPVLGQLADGTAGASGICSAGNYAHLLVESVSVEKQVGRLSLKRLKTLYSGFDQIFLENRTGKTVDAMTVLIGNARCEIPGLEAGEVWTTCVKSGVDIDTVPIATYKITYKPGLGDVGEQQTDTKVEGSPLALKGAIFTRTGYTQTGWATRDGGAKVYDLGASYTANAAVTLWPYWKANTYTLSFDSEGGSAVSPIKQAYGTAVAAPAAPTRTGYTFAGWTPELPVTMPAENLTFTAQWTKNPDPVMPEPVSPDPVTPTQEVWTVTFNANGGAVADGALGTTRPTIEVSVEKGKAVGDLPEPERKGYTFNGWYTKTSGGTKIKTSTKVKKDVTYYAQWTANQYTIKFNANGGTGTMKSLAATYGKSVTLTANAFKRTNYTFLGWATEKDATEAEYKNKAKVKNLSAKSGGTATLYAVWKRNTYTVKFSANGGDDDPVKQKMNCGATKALAKNTFERPGFKFAGWAVKKNGPVVYKNKAKVKDLAANGKSITLYAVWRLADWAVGTFTGKGKIGGKSANVTLTVTSDGKISGKFVRKTDKKSFSFKADRFEDCDDAYMYVETEMKYGSKTYLLEIYLEHDEETGTTYPYITVSSDEGDDAGWGFSY